MSMDTITMLCNYSLTTFRYVWSLRSAQLSIFKSSPKCLGRECCEGVRNPECVFLSWQSLVLAQSQCWLLLDEQKAKHIFPLVMCRLCSIFGVLRKKIMNE